MSSIRLSLTYKASCSSNSQTIQLEIKEWEDKTVEDLKKIIQNTLSIPICDQRLFYPELHFINDDSVSLKSLYLRDGDNLYLTYISEIDIKGMDPLIHDLLDFASDIEKWKKDDVFNVNDIRSPSDYPRYDMIARATEKLAFEYFIPWKSQLSIAQRHYFVQRGAFVKFFEVLKFSELKYTCTYNPELDYSIRELGALVDYYNNEQMVLHMHCLSLLWNFSETDFDRKLVLQNQGLKAVCDALMTDPTVYSPEDNTFWVINSLIETAVGCLVQYAEYSSTQDVIASNKNAINKLVYMVECRLHRDTNFFNLYSCQIAANTLFLCACNSRTPAVLVENNVHLQMIKLTKGLINEDHDMALRYYCCLFLARIVACPLNQLLESEIIEEINSLLGTFLELHSPSQVSRWEEKHNYVWVTMLPFLSLAFSDGFSPNRSLLKGPGTLLTQRIGLFCIDHMSMLNENRVLLAKEGLLPYILCLSWYLEGTDKESIENVLQRLPAADPPSLSTIARSQIARLKGLEYASSLVI